MAEPLIKHGELRVGETHCTCGKPSTKLIKVGEEEVAVCEECLTKYEGKKIALRSV